MHRRRFLKQAVSLAATTPLWHSASSARGAAEPLENPQLEKVVGIDPPIQADDFTIAGLRRVQQAVKAYYGADYYHLPLAAKADYYEWQLWRYHRTPWRQVQHYAQLPAATAQPPTWHAGSDSSTWNGALLAALSYKYAVTKSPKTLERIIDLLAGLNLFFTVTRQPGLAARNVSLDKQAPEQELFTMPDGTQFYFRGDPAKGGYNQLAGGLAALMMHVYDDLPPATQQMVRVMVTDFVMHVIVHDYHLTRAGGQRTPYGNLTPMVGHMSVPFNAQVAYEIVALGKTFPPQSVQHHTDVNEQYRRLREKHHVYYREPWRHIVVPQRIGDSPLVKGMNDRNHVANAAFVGLALELHAARRDSRPADGEFLYQLGQTLYLTIQNIQWTHHSLCNFMWSGLINDPNVFKAMVPKKQESARSQADRLIFNGIEQLRHFPLDRFMYKGEEVKMSRPVSIDYRVPGDYHWKDNPRNAWRRTGPETGQVTCRTDYLYAYWLMRYFQLDQHSRLQRHAAVLS